MAVITRERESVCVCVCGCGFLCFLLGAGWLAGWWWWGSLQVSAGGRHAGTLQDTTGEGDEVLFCHTEISCSVLSCTVQCRYSTVLPAIVACLGSHVNVP